jgi:hypothetical protein
MRGWRGLATVTATLLLAACGAGPAGPTPTPTHTPKPDPVAAAWHACGATQVPPKSVREAPVHGNPVVHFGPGASDRWQQVELAWTRTDAYAGWAITKNQLGFLQRQCISAPLSRTEEGDQKIIREAQAKGGHAVFDPEPYPVRIGVEVAPAAVADAVERRVGTRPEWAVAILVPGGRLWVEDDHGRRIGEIGRDTGPGFYGSVVMGSLRTDGIGLRYWQQWLYACQDPEVAGICDAAL